MTRRAAPVYFADENALGLGKLLERAGREDFVYPGHPALPEIPLGSPDLEWMPIVGRKGLIVITRDRRIRTRPAELDAYRECGIRSVWIGTTRNLAPQAQVELFLSHEFRLQKMAVRLGPGPWAVVMNSQGVRELRIKSAP